MKRDYETGSAEDVVFFTGIEVEKTPAFGKKTLFVTGIQKYVDIKKHYDCDFVAGYALARSASAGFSQLGYC